MIAAEYDYELDMAVQRKEARQQGVQEGKLEEKRTTARSLRNIGMETDKIVTVTGLSKEEIERL